MPHSLCLARKVRRMCIFGWLMMALVWGSSEAIADLDASLGPLEYWTERKMTHEHMKKIGQDC
eukprot:2950437-Amphidinium_carterae.1